MKRCLLIFASVAQLFASEAIDVKRDVPLQTVWYMPHKPPSAPGNDGFLGGYFRWHCYPEVAQSFKGDKKTIFLAVEIDGPMHFVYAALSFSIDGDVVDMPPLLWGRGQLLGGLPEAETMLPDQEALIRKIAGAKEVWLTVFGGDDDGRHSVLLNPKQLAVFGIMLERYDSAEPK